MSLNPTEWSSVQANLRGLVGEEDFNSWLSPLQPALTDSTESSSANSVSLSVPTRFMQDWINQHYGEAIKKSLAKTLNREVDISYVVTPVMEPAAPPVVTSEVKTPTPATPTTQHITNSGHLDPKFIFETFVTGKSNDFAYAAALRIAEDDKATYNPFFLHGGVGLGKTHLMHAIGNKMKETSPERNVLYISAEQFMHRFIRALKDKKTLSFKDTLRSVDVLMVDDIQFIAGKETTQEEFFHTFNALVSMGKQVILTADRSPHEMDRIEDRLKSRLGCGLTCEIHAPDVETRLAILQKKAEELNLDLPRDVGIFLADGISSNVRELEGALNRLAAHANITGAAITLNFAQEQLKDLFRANTRLLTMEDIQAKIADYYNIKLSDLHGARRLRCIARPRQVAMFLAKKLTTRSYPDIGRSFGGRDHTTVMHAVRTIENLMGREANLQEDVALLEKMLTNR